MVLIGKHDMYTFGSTFLKKEDYGEIVNDLYKVDLPYAKVLRVTKEQMMMEDNRQYSLPEKVYYASRLTGRMDEIPEMEVGDYSGEYILEDYELIETLRKENVKVLSIQQREQFAHNTFLIVERSKQLEEERKKQAIQERKEHQFAIFIQKKIEILTHVWRRIFLIRFHTRNICVTL